MTCRELVDFLFDYTADDLEPDAKAEFERHLSRCPPCLAYVRSYQATINACKAARDHVIELTDVPEELIQAILAARRAQAGR